MAKADDIDVAEVVDGSVVVDGAVVESMVVTLIEAVVEDEIGKDVVEIGISTCQT